MDGDKDNKRKAFVKKSRDANIPVQKNQIAIAIPINN